MGKLGDADISEAVSQRDVASCARAIRGVLDPAALPQRVEELPEHPDEILRPIGL
eukprot:NODE_11888_length_271_cov_179.814815.p2 GENE.NODE_11888_length_271_cov_179.814815~~NODE_11888_length_271_cov_179.814815.p2  ORF type:complete len:55 (+),score=18.73 NODE_11888_length_271_cov_179.814815:3-167(+)